MKRFKGYAEIWFDITVNTEEEVYDIVESYDIGDSKIKLIDITEEDDVDYKWDEADRINDERRCHAI